MKRIGLAALLWAAATWPAARAQESREVRFVPNIPPCIDHVLLGHLRSRGSEWLDIPDDWLGNEIYTYSLEVDRTILGTPGRRRVRLKRVGVELPRYDHVNTVVFLRRTDRSFDFADSAIAVPDRRGRLFLPLLRPPAPSNRNSNWLRDGFESVARPIDYSEHDMRFAGYGQAALKFYMESSGGLIESRDGRLFVRRGIYLEDIPAVIALGVPGGCWR